jgi:2-keto-4-pentenoate hydratase
LADLSEAAARLRAAYAGGSIPPLRDWIDPLDQAGAYAVQSINARIWADEGRRVVGRKVGLTAAAVQAQLGVDQPDFGILFDDMEIADGGTLSAHLLQPKAEAEVAIIMARDVLDPQATAQTIAAAVDHAVTAIEIVDSRIADWKISFADTVADNGSSAFFVLGRERKPIQGLDLWSCGMVLEIDGQVASLGAGAACLGHPLHALAWLVRTLSASGEGLKAGDIVLTGALGPMVTLTPDTLIKASVGGLGSCGFRYEGGQA